MALNATAGSPATALMDRIYRQQRFIYDATRKYYLFGRDRLIADLTPGDGSVLEIGCGTGRNLIKAAWRYPQARLFGIDVSTAMLGVAQSSLARRNLAERVQVALADATVLEPPPFAQRTYDRVFFSYTLSMIPDWHAALDQAITLLGPSGRLHIVDFGLLDGCPALFRRALFAWLGAFHVHPIGSLKRSLEGLADRHGLRMTWRQLFRGYAVSATLERMSDLQPRAKSV